MMNVHHALIIAAGRGSRFGAATEWRPKPLIEIDGIPLICRVFSCASQAGIDGFTVVTGYKGEILEEYLCRNVPPGISVRFLRNEFWWGLNGISVLRAKGHLPGLFVLLMADHLFDSRILKNLLVHPLPRGHCRLAVDFHLGRVSDLADATKVSVRGGWIADIGKGIENYNAVDTGIFFCSHGIFDALEKAISAGRAGLSDGILELAHVRKMEALDIGDLFWRDIDDGEGLLDAEKWLKGKRDQG
ncbi:MAG: NTP transferase domain-containing protein [Syntrophales bacterium]